MSVRVRIAPSPTGDPHVGTAYIGLLNWSFARKHGGRFVLRIEDTDQGRCTAESAQAINDSLHWLGITPDEGPGFGGDRGPYVQSQRHAQGIYRRHAEALVAGGHAYPCFCSSERLDTVRKQQEADKQRLGYDRHCRDLAPAEAARRVIAGEPHVIRLKVPLEGAFSYRDRLRKDPFVKEWIDSDDQVLVKSDGWPTYHLAAVVDDYEMGITHVIRAEEWLNSLPKHVHLGRCLGFPIPEYVHVGLLRNADGSKISKRKNPTNILWYRRMGYLPGALLNYLGTLGHSHPDGKDIFDLAEMARIVDLDRLSVGGPVFDLQKLDHVQGEWLRALPDAELKRAIHEALDQRLDDLLPILRPRLTFGSDITWITDFIFKPTVEPRVEDLVPKGWDAGQTGTALGLVQKEIEKALKAGDCPWTAPRLEQLIRALAEAKEWKPKLLFGALRVAITGRTEAPPLFDAIAEVGQVKSLQRLASAVAKLAIAGRT